MTAAWIIWTQIEQFSAWHSIPLATKANGLEGADALLEFNNPITGKHIGNLATAQKDKTFDYGGRTSEPEGKFVNGTIRLWPADGTGDPLILTGHKRSVRAASFSPDGRRVVSGGADGSVRLWSDDGTGEPLIG